MNQQPAALMNSSSNNSISDALTIPKSEWSQYRQSDSYLWLCQIPKPQIIQGALNTVGLESIDPIESLLRQLDSWRKLHLTDPTRPQKKFEICMNILVSYGKCG